ncbi:tripartite tricarboxylate transporter substrate binding protein [Aquincola tertiaricarbonis]|uniref:Tripartite tricarboxylate transporter substrate binding protein n=1 Tax=Aquincola tertiaricarbonis TaxID=391953 RepID=A0ABY4S866_AQUTE|nr:tripartite tricarboxylate transporter substrate binding protein [Aquincola tertiaricarbonis]URI07490.1 tripartite tricarboxylate transporter substrate binding protein [Aquincola tertiaricarbonis]
MCSDLQRRRLLQGAAAAAGLAATGWALAAEPWAGNTLRIVVPLAPGGSADAMCRLVGNALGRVLGTTVIVENKPGAGGVTGLAEVVKARPDGSTLGYSLAGALTVAPHIARHMPFDPLKDLAAVTQVVAVPEVLVVHPKTGVRSLGALVAKAKAAPGQLNFGSAGNATVPHLGGELLKREAGIDLVHVPYKGSGPALNDLLAGQVDLMVADVTLVRPHIAAGRLLALAVAGPARLAELPDVPTTAQAGLPGLAISNWHGMVAPAGTPPELLARLQQAVAEALKAPEVAARLDQEGADPVASTPAQFAAFLRGESARSAALVKALGIRWE